MINDLSFEHLPETFKRRSWLKSVIPAHQVDQMRGIIEAHKSAAIEPLRRDAKERVIRLDDLLGRDPLFMSVFTSEIILSPLQSLLGPNIELVLNRHNHASFNFAGDNDLRLHRDVLQWSRSVVTVFIVIWVDDPKKILVCGEKLYRGNDAQR